MAEEAKKEQGEKAEAAPAAAAPKSGRKKLLFIIGGVVVLALAIGTPLVFMSMGSKEVEEEQLDADAAHTVEHGTLEGSLDEDLVDEEGNIIGAIYPLESFVVNLQGGRYVRCQLQLEFATREVPQRFYVRAVPIRDALIKLLASRTAEELLGEKGRDELKEAVKEVVNEVLKKEEVQAVYFTQFVVQ